MSWTKYKEMFKLRKAEELHFILGVDIGDEASSVAYYNHVGGAPELIDMSGGYGKPSSPTAMQYITETKEWVFGEYAVLNKGIGGDISFSGLIEELGKKDFEITGKPVSASYLLSLYIKELVANCKNLNPKAEIAGMVACVPSYMPDDAKNAFLEAVRLAGLEKSLITLAADRECALGRLYFDTPVVSENVLLLDFGSRELRGGVYKVEPKEGGARVTSLSSLFDKKIGTQAIDNTVLDYFTSFYAEKAGVLKEKLPEQALSQLSAFTYQHKDLLFQKNRLAKAVKVYYNFAYPPFSQQITAADVENIMRPFYNRFSTFISDAVKKAKQGDKDKINIGKVVCTGGGFEMHWAKEALQKAFPYSEVKIYKNSKGMAAEGASVIAASLLGILPAQRFEIEDSHQLKADIGVLVKQSRNSQFIPLIPRNSFWWQTKEPKRFIVNEPTDKPLFIEILKRDEYGATTVLDKLAIEGLPSRPAGTTRLNMSLEFSSQNKLTATISDMGFGELFPLTDYSQKFMINL